MPADLHLRRCVIFCSLFLIALILAGPACISSLHTLDIVRVTYKDPVAISYTTNQEERVFHATAVKVCLILRSFNWAMFDDDRIVGRMVRSALPTLGA